MRAETFVPGHISCVFRPVKGESPETTGSLGFGIRLDMGCHASVGLRDDGVVSIRINGEECEADITRCALDSIRRGHGLDVDLVHDLPLEQGFGSSASGTLAAALCAADLLCIDRSEAVAATHRAECTLGGGLGDLLAIECPSGVPLRTVAGPPCDIGRCEDTGLGFRELTLVVFDETLSTPSVLGDPGMMRRIESEGDKAMSSFRADPSLGTLFESAKAFSEGIGLESERMKDALRTIREGGGRAGMCMLGNSIYSDVPVSVAR
jgi:pantoate kinase